MPPDRALTTATRTRTSGGTPRSGVVLVDLRQQVSPVHPAHSTTRRQAPGTH